jgi:DNA-dependent RNA polymerase auxiliary subunit epsilon
MCSFSVDDASGEVLYLKMHAKEKKRQFMLNEGQMHITMIDILSPETGGCERRILQSRVCAERDVGTT